MYVCVLYTVCLSLFALIDAMLAGHISSFYELMGVTEQWIIKSGVQDRTARRFVSSFYQSMASAADCSEDSFEELSVEVYTVGSPCIVKYLYVYSLGCGNCDSSDSSIFIAIIMVVVVVVVESISVFR